MSKGTVLVAVSAASKLRLASGAMADTGTYLNELVVPVMTLMEAGYDYVLATPTGAKPTIDEASQSASHFGGSETEYARATAFFETDPVMQKPRLLRDIVAGGLDRFDAVFTPGGAAPITDLSQDEDFGKILVHFHERAKPTALLCHGPVALLASVKDMRGFRSAVEIGDTVAAKEAAAKGWPYKGYNMTIFTNEEEHWIEDNVLHGVMQWYVVDAMKIAGGNVTKSAELFEPYVVTDRELITGQNPRSDKPVVEALLKALEHKQASLAVA